MYLKKLEILGFKSFANKTVIDFSRGITAVVGPNGCGKTNILDALRWVLGEQKISMLRGSKMEEVIFNGTRDTKPLGMAEVTLTIVNNRGVLPTEYTEVQITRRLFRSGESEYLLNKVPCRLKDITELFYDTGVGAHSYSVIQQDMIEAVISDKAEERRFLFEEASGITKYKQRKKAAMRKMEATENDFLRLNDIYAEVQTQVRSLKRQQKKAERYQMISDDIKKWELYLSSQRIKAIENERREIKAQLDSFNDNISEREARINMLSSEIEGIRKEQIDNEHELTNVGNTIYEISEKAHILEKEISILKEKKLNATTLIERNTNEIEAFKARLELLKDQKNENENNLETCRKEYEELLSELETSERVQQEADQRLLESKSSKESNHQKLIELEGRLSSGKTEDVNLRQQEDELSASIEKLKTQFDDNNRVRESIFEKQSLLSQQKNEIGAKKRTTEEQYKEYTSKLQELLTSLEDLAEEISSVNASIEACQARKNLLEEMIIHFEGYESGVKAAMETRERWSGIYGTVAEKFVPVEGMEVAVEATLGEMSKFLICNNRPTAESIIRYLKDENKGRIGILVPDIGTINPAVKRPELDMPEFLGWMDSFVTTEEHLQPLMHAVLSRTAVFKADFKPDELLKHLPYGFKAVSTTGEVFSKNMISGGSNDKIPLFRRKEKVKEQEDIISESQRQLDSLNDKRSRINVEIAELRSEISRLSSEMESVTEDLKEAENNFNEVDYQIRGIDTEMNRLQKEIKNQTDKRESIRNRQYTLGLDFDQLKDLRAQLDTKIKESSEQLNEYEKAAAEALDRVSRLQVKLVESRSQVEQFESKISHLAEIRQELTSNIDIKTNEIETARSEIVNSSEKAETLESELKNVFEQRKEHNLKQNELRSNQNDILGVINEKEKLLKSIRGEKDEYNEKSHRIDIKLTTLNSEASTIIERIQNEYELDIKSVDAIRPESEITDDEAKANLVDLKNQLKKFGAVNLLALEEYKTASEREQFLKEQLDDLKTAKDDLQATITKINHTARQLFAVTFEKVKINFKHLFTELFTGGEADIFLTDPSDPLESDIDIIARPRGKKLISITMMSGGERALTAISLLFSLYLVKPSPFCILDEIDAPLDDANCKRFLKIIDKFSNQTQFITITHNKITMEAAHNLYGVTMEQFGISKIVAVKFNEDVHKVTNSDDMLMERDSIDPDEFNKPVKAKSDETPKQDVDIDELTIDLDEEIEDENGNGNGNGKSTNAPVTDIKDADEELPQKIIERISQPLITNTDKSDIDRD